MASTTYLALADEDGVVHELALFTEAAAYTRSENEWVPVSADEDAPDPIDGMVALEASEAFIPIFDMADETDGTLTEHDVI